MTHCRHCKHSRAELVAYDVVLMCAFWRAKAVKTCAEYEREPGADDDR
jgi:hypothetical protein